MRKRSNLLVMVGLAVFLLGGAAVLLVLRDDGDDAVDTASSTAPQATSVVVATRDIDPGTSGSDMVANGFVRVKEVVPGGKAADALSSTGELVGQIAAIQIKEGEQLRIGALRSETLRRQSIKIPEGKQAVAAQLDFVPGVAGYVGPGDVLNIYSTIKNAPVPGTRLLLSNVEVLDVSTEIAPRRAASAPDAPERPNTSAVTFLFALDAVQAERLIFADANGELYGTLVPKGQGPSATPGHSFANLFQK